MICSRTGKKWTWSVVTSPLLKILCPIIQTLTEKIHHNIKVRDGTVSCGYKKTNLTVLSVEDNVNVNNRIWAWAPGIIKKLYGLYSITLLDFFILTNTTWLFSKSNIHFLFIFPCYPGSAGQNKSVYMDLSCKDQFPKINERWGKIFLKIIFPPWNLHLTSTITFISSAHIVSNFILKYKCCTLANKSITHGFTSNITTGIHCMFAQVTETIAFVQGKRICFKIHIVFQEKAIMNYLKLLELPLSLAFCWGFFGPQWLP